MYCMYVYIHHAGYINCTVCMCSELLALEKLDYALQWASPRNRHTSMYNIRPDCQDQYNTMFSTTAYKVQ